MLARLKMELDINAVKPSLQSPYGCCSRVCVKAMFTRGGMTGHKDRRQSRRRHQSYRPLHMSTGGYITPDIQRGFAQSNDSNRALRLDTAQHLLHVRIRVQFGNKPIEPWSYFRCSASVNYEKRVIPNQKHDRGTEGFLLFRNGASVLLRLPPPSNS
ncbi:hypothetical protein CAPTEDRAFT_198851 [Capitella teleta]|uniref:Uncharacterized protein n=1 Tax=Capitella teleta TaxID=283909 RepID=R7T7S7_CAPTE|nr:hypothetical protein CAPTEDRAFT_198851 [Capitella teleta]|eukprot:ELT87475.1 hypothetical protein CAPTEDRAFT_198851 [Capitella teleta]